MDRHGLWPLHEPSVIANVVWQSMNPLFSTMDRRAGRHCEERMRRGNRDDESEASSLRLPRRIPFPSLRAQRGNPWPRLFNDGSPRFARDDGRRFKVRLQFRSPETGSSR